MKKSFIIIIFLSLCFTIPSEADDIGDFQIEGMSVGDSLLDYFSEEEIISNIKKLYEGSDEKFSAFLLDIHSQY